MKLAIFLSILFMPAIALAESHSLYGRDNWNVEYVVTDSGMTWCSVKKENSLGHTYDLTFYGSGNFRFFVFFDFPDTGEEKEVDFYLHFDEEVWEVSKALLEGNMISFHLGNNVDKITDFLTDMARRNRAYLISANGEKIITDWSLAGSSRALEAFYDCASKL